MQELYAFEEALAREKRSYLRIFRPNELRQPRLYIRVINVVVPSAGRPRLDECSRSRALFCSLVLRIRRRVESITDCKGPMRIPGRALPLAPLDDEFRDYRRRAAAVPHDPADVHDGDSA